jgi:hypothetical protein
VPIKNSKRDDDDLERDLRKHAGKKYIRKQKMSDQERQPTRRSRFGLLEAFLLFILFLFLADTALQYILSASVANKASKEVLNRTAAVIEHEAASIRKTTEILLLQAKNSAARKTFDFFDYRAANALFMSHMEANPHITSVNYGDSAGNGYLILFESGRWRNRIKKSANEGVVTWVFFDNNGKVLPQEQQVDDYDPRVRPWYAAAAGSPAIHWSRPYIFRTTHDVGITASMAIDPGKDGYAGVIGADVMLKDLSQFVSRLKSGHADLSINLVSRRGEILASSEVDNFLGILRKGSNELPRISDDGTFTSGALGWKEIIHPDDMGQVQEASRRAEKGKKSHSAWSTESGTRTATSGGLKTGGS